MKKTNTKNNNVKNQHDEHSHLVKPMKLSVYFSMLVSGVIVLVSLLFAFYTIFSIKNLASSFESDIYKLRYSISATLVQTLIIDSQRQEFSATRAMINNLKSEKLLVYAYITDNTTNNVIFGEEYKPTGNKSDIQNLSKDIGNYTVFFGIQTKSSVEQYYIQFFKVMSNILLIIIILGIIVSILIAGLIAKPLKKLSITAKRLSKGNFNVKIEESTFSEINDLISSYNEMGVQLNELYTSLETKVKQRTLALKEANYKLQETQAMMVHSEKMRSLGELVAGIAHEINNPVNFIHGNIMILQNYVDDLFKLIDLYDKNFDNFPKEIKDEVDKLKKDIDLDFLRTDITDLIKSCTEGTQRTKNIVLDLKNFSRMEEMVLTQFDIPKEIDTTLNILNNKYKNRITVVKNYAENLPKIEAYGGQLNQVFMNILDNAQDAMGESGTLTINAFKINTNVIIEFIDTGKGIPKENLSKVFDPFFTTKAVGKGTGLGMSISYRVIKDHNGKIEVESEVGVGTKFTLTLPINHVAQNNNVDKNKQVV